MPSSIRDYQDQQFRPSAIRDYQNSQFSTSQPGGAAPGGAAQAGPAKPADAPFDPNANTNALLKVLREGGNNLNDVLRSIKAGVTQEDIDLVGQTAQAGGDIARRNMQASLPMILDQISGGDFARGLGGSSIAAANRSIAGAQAVRSMENIGSQQQQFASGNLLGQANQRANFQMGQNRQLFNQLVGTVMPQLGFEQELQRRREGEANKPGFFEKYMGPIAQLGGAAIGLAVGGPPGAAAGYQAGSAVSGKGSTANYNQTADFGRLQGGDNPYDWLNN